MAMDLAVEHPKLAKSLVRISASDRSRSGSFPRRYIFVKWVVGSGLFGKHRQLY